MALDPSIFTQYAQLNAQQNAQNLGQLTNAIQGFKEQKRYDQQMELEKQKLENQGFDLEKLATPALIKMQMGETLTPQDQAVLKAWDLTETRKLAPDATGNYRKVNASIFDGGGFDLGTIAPVPPVSSQPLPDTFAGGVAPMGVMSDAQFDAIPAAPLPVSGGPLNVGMLQPTGDPGMDAYRAKMFEQNGAMQDNLPAVPSGGFDTGLVAPPEARTPITVPPELANNPNAAQKYLEAAAAAQVDIGKAGAVETAKLRAEKAAGKSKTESALIEKAEKTQDIDEMLTQAIGMVSNQTAGMGSQIKDIPIVGKGSKAGDLAAILETIGADSAFSELQTMRDNSKTGGALGGIAVEELKMLRAAKAAIQQDQSPAQLKAGLKKYQEIRRKGLQRAYEAFERENGYRPGAQTSPNQPQGGAKSWQEYFN